jgi:hypothetical protein
MHSTSTDVTFAGAVHVADDVKVSVVARAKSIGWLIQYPKAVTKRIIAREILDKARFLYILSLSNTRTLLISSFYIT